MRRLRTSCLSAAAAVCLVAYDTRAQSANFSVLHTFGGESQAGYGPNGVIHGSDGAFYGTTQNGGTEDRGVVFRAGPDGSYSVLHDFRSADRAGEYSSAPLLDGSNGIQVSLGQILHGQVWLGPGGKQP